MRTAASKSNPNLGFLTVVEHAEHGLFGGYLILNQAGRPLEFHCTAPIKPNRAQQILYGPTLEPYLFAEQIGQTLLAKAKAEPTLVCTDRAAALAVREFVDVPVVLVLGASEPAGEVSSEGEAASPNSGRFLRVDGAHTPRPAWREFAVRGQRVAVSLRAEDDQEQATRRFSELAESFDLAEPFQRIREAIEEAQRGS